MHGHGHLARLDHDERPAGLALLGDRRAGGVGPLHELAGQALEELVVGLRKERDAAEQVRSSGSPHGDPIPPGGRVCIMSAMSSREGGCSCGAVRYRLTSDPLFTHCCHCLNCQRQTGSAFVINLLIEADRLEFLAGEAQPVDAPRDDGSKQRIFRCPICQVAVFSEYGRPEVKFVRGGTLDEPSSITPDVHIYTRSKLGWVTIPDSVPAFEVYYDSKSLWPAASLARVRASRARRSDS